MKCLTQIVIFSIYFAAYNRCCAKETAGKVQEVRSSADDISSHPNLGLLPQDCGHGAVNQVTGGQEATIAEFPWLGLVAYNIRNGTGWYGCTGTLINERYVLTASHCLKDQESDPKKAVTQMTGVRLGNRQDIPVEKQIAHPEYNGWPKWHNDIALLRLMVPVDFSNKDVHPICLPVTKAQMTRNLSGQNGTLAVWGRGKRTYLSDVLFRYYTTMQSEAECVKTMDSYSNPQPAEDLKVLCAMDCNAAAATPFSLEETDDGSKSKHTLYGLFSFGKSCPLTLGDVYTDVSKHVKWILDNIEP